MLENILRTWDFFVKKKGLTVNHRWQLCGVTSGAGYMSTLYTPTHALEGDRGLRLLRSALQHLMSPASSSQKAATCLSRLLFRYKTDSLWVSLSTISHRWGDVTMTNSSATKNKIIMPLSRLDPGTDSRKTLLNYLASKTNGIRYYLSKSRCFYVVLKLYFKIYP